MPDTEKATETAWIGDKDHLGKEGKEKTRSYKLLVEITGVDDDLRTDAVLDMVADWMLAGSLASTARVTNISRFGSIYKRR